MVEEIPCVVYVPFKLEINTFDFDGLPTRDMFKINAQKKGGAPVSSPEVHLGSGRRRSVSSTTGEPVDTGRKTAPPGPPPTSAAQRRASQSNEANVFDVVKDKPAGANFDPFAENATSGGGGGAAAPPAFDPFNSGGGAGGRLAERNT